MIGKAIKRTNTNVFILLILGVYLSISKHPAVSAEEVSLLITDQGFIPNELRVHRWQTIKLTLRSEEKDRSFTIEKLGINIKKAPRQRIKNDRVLCQSAL